MLLRAFGVLFFTTALSVVVSACSGGGGPDFPKCDSDSLDWESFKMLDRPDLRASSLDDLSDKAGFHVVLPSYLPSGLGCTLFLSSQFGPASRGQAQVSTVPSEDSSRWIQIDEHVRPAGEPMTTSYGEDYDVHTIGGILVGCLTEMPDERWPTPAPGQEYSATFECGWQGKTDGLDYRVSFSWRIEKGDSLELKPEWRDEAMKVVTSMIEEPYIP
jgi:hypothetical protein